MNPTELHRLSELRSLLEGFAARKAATHRGPLPELGELRNALRQLSGAVRRRDYAAFRSADERLHSLVVRTAAVPALPEVWRTVWNALQSFHQQGFEQCFPDARVLIEEHEHLVETIALRDPAAAEDAARNHVEAVWFRIAEQRRQHASDLADPLARAVAHIAFRLHSSLRLSEIARKVAFTSAGNLSRLFRQRYGIGFKAYVLERRIEKAAELLRSTRVPVARIARRVGYRDCSRFCQHFRRRYRTTPRKWRGAPESGTSRRQ